MFADALLAEARNLLEAAREKRLHIVTAESCTGGLIAGLLTEIPGSSDVVERGFVTYSNEAKEELLGVPRNCSRHMARYRSRWLAPWRKGALKHSRAERSIAVTGIAGPGGGTRCKAGGPGLYRRRPPRRRCHDPRIPLRRHRTRQGAARHHREIAATLTRQSLIHRQLDAMSGELVVRHLFQRLHLRPRQTQIHGDMLTVAKGHRIAARELPEDHQACQNVAGGTAMLGVIGP